MRIWTSKCIKTVIVGVWIQNLFFDILQFIIKIVHRHEVFGKSNKHKKRRGFVSEISRLIGKNFYWPILWNNSFRKQVYEGGFYLISCSTIFEKVFDKRTLFVFLLVEKSFSTRLALRTPIPTCRYMIWIFFYWTLY